MDEEPPVGTASNEDWWVSINMLVPPGVANPLFELLKAVGWRETDWCEMTHEALPGGAIHYGPHVAPTIKRREVA